MTSSELVAAIQAIYPTATLNDFICTADANGNASIRLWNNAIGVQPTVAQLQVAIDNINLKAAQQLQISILENAYLNARFGTTVSITAASGNYTFPCDQMTQTNIVGYLTAYSDGALPNGSVPLIDANSATQHLVYTDLKLLGKAIADASVTSYNKFESLCNQVKAATTVAAVQAIVWQ